MAVISLSAEDLGVLANAYPNKALWEERVHIVDGNLQVPDDLDPPISVVDFPAVKKAYLLAYARQRRWAIEVGGIVVAGMPIATDDRSKVMIAGARTSADADPSFVTSWDAGATDIELNAGQIIAISNAVRDHVAAVFAKFKAVRTGIESGSIVSRNDIDAAFAA